MNRKSYLILGGSSGIGLAIARKLANDNQRVIIVGSNENKLKTAISTLSGEDHLYIKYNLEELDSINNIFEKCIVAGVKLNGMVYCAGISPLRLLRDNTPDLMYRVYSINLFAFIECCKYFYDSKFSNDDSRIVVIASNAAHTAGYRQAIYGSSKAAIVAAVRLMAKELYNRKITINCISPGATETEMLGELRKYSSNLDEKILCNQPMGIIKPEYIAEIANLLLGRVANFMTGNEIVYDAASLLK